MARWAPNAAGRLHDAALELFSERGFEQTTVSEISERAGLTERTFFNHFASKREVLFGRSAELHIEAVAREILALPAGTPPLRAMVHGLRVVAEEMLEPLRDRAARRREIIDATPELQEREQSKRAALSAAIAGALRERGLDPDAALLTAGTGTLVQQIAELRWTRPDERRPLGELLAETLASLRETVRAG